SSVDSAINSCTSVVVVDFYNRLVLGRQTDDRGSRGDDRRQVLVARVATVGFGALGTLLAINVSRIGSLLEIANKLINAFTGPLFGIYLLATLIVGWVLALVLRTRPSAAALKLTWREVVAETAFHEDTKASKDTKPSLY